MSQTVKASFESAHSKTAQSITSARELVAGWQAQQDAGEDTAVIANWTPREGHILTVTRAISARVNQNFDGFPSEELKKAYSTFLGKPVFVNHLNDDPTKARGRVVGARYVENGNDKYIEVIQEVNAKKFPLLAKELTESGLDSVSMGCSAERTICSFCGNVATGMLDMCTHVLNSKGRKLRRQGANGQMEDVLVYEECRDLGFFELSYVFDPADETAVVSNLVVASKKPQEKISAFGSYNRVYCDLPGCNNWAIYNSERHEQQWVGGGGELRPHDYCCEDHRDQYEKLFPSWKVESVVNNPIKFHALQIQAWGEIEAPEAQYAKYHDDSSEVSQQQQEVRHAGRDVPGVREGAAQGPQELSSAGAVRRLLPEGEASRSTGGYSAAANPSAGSQAGAASNRNSQGESGRRVRGAEDREGSRRQRSEELGGRAQARHGADSGTQVAARRAGAPQEPHQVGQPTGEPGAMGRESVHGRSAGRLDRVRGGAPSGRGTEGSRHLAWGEQEAPEAVDTLRDDSEEQEEEFHQYVESPPGLADPDLDKARELDRREEMGEGYEDMSDYLQDEVAEGNGLDEDLLSDPAAVDELGEQLDPVTGEPIPNEESPEVDPITGEPVEPESDLFDPGDPGEQIDPITGEPIEAEPEVDPITGEPVDPDLVDPGDPEMVDPDDPFAQDVEGTPDEVMPFDAEDEDNPFKDDEQSIVPVEKADDVEDADALAVEDPTADDDVMVDPEDPAFMQQQDPAASPAVAPEPKVPPEADPTQQAPVEKPPVAPAPPKAPPPPNPLGDEAAPKKAPAPVAPKTEEKPAAPKAPPAAPAGEEPPAKKTKPVAQPETNEVAPKPPKPDQVSPPAPEKSNKPNDQPAEEKSPEKDAPSPVEDSDDDDDVMADPGDPVSEDSAESPEKVDDSDELTGLAEQLGISEDELLELDPDDLIQLLDADGSDASDNKEKKMPSANNKTAAARKDNTMSRDSLAQRGRVASRGRVADQSRNDQGEMEETFLTQTPPAEPVETADGEEITNTEDNLVATIRAKQAELKRLRQAKQRKTADDDSFLADGSSEGETADVVNPELSGTDAQDLKGDFESADPNEGVVETQPKDASRKAKLSRRRAEDFAAWVRKTAGKPVKEASSVGELRTWVSAYSKAAKIQPEVLYPLLKPTVVALRKRAADDEGVSGDSKTDDIPDFIQDKIEGDSDKESARKNASQRKVADEKLDVAAPDGRVDVEAPVANDTDDEAQASQFDKNDFGNNAGDNIADPDLGTNQNWAPGEGKQSTRMQLASGVNAVRLARAYINAGMESEDQEWVLAAQFEKMSAAVVNDRLALLDRVLEVQPQRTQTARKTAGTRGAPRSVQLPQNLSPQGVAPQQRTAAADDSSDDSMLFL